MKKVAYYFYSISQMVFAERYFKKLGATVTTKYNVDSMGFGCCKVDVEAPEAILEDFEYEYKNRYNDVVTRRG